MQALYTRLPLFNLQVYDVVNNSPLKKSVKNKQHSLPKQDTTSPRPSKKVFEVHSSAVHGKGVFAISQIPENHKVVEYKGELITWEHAQLRHPHDPKQPNHTFFFQRDDGMVIDGGAKGNAARWINHSCSPNCEAREENGRIYIYTLQKIEPGEELNYDYGLVLEGRQTKKLKAEYACYCGNPNCTGTMLAPKKRR